MRQGFSEQLRECVRTRLPTLFFDLSEDVVLGFSTKKEYVGLREIRALKERGVS